VPLSVPLPYLLTGVTAAALFGVILPWLVVEAAHAPLDPHVLALVHLVTLGWLTMTILGASLQLLPVILVSPLRAARLVRWQYPAYLCGVLAMLTGFWTMYPLVIAAGGMLVALAVGHYVIVMAITIAQAQQRPLTARFLAGSLVYLCLVVAFGLTAALNLRFGFLGAGVLRVLPAHIALGIAGWLTCTLMGVSYTLVRMFALAHGHDDRIGRYVFVLLNVGIVLLALGFLLASGLVLAIGGTAFCAASWLFAYDYTRMLRVRRRKPLDATQRHGIAAVSYLCILAPLTMLGVLAGWGEPQLFVALGLGAFVGWLGQSTIGYLYKIVPFLIWQDRYGELVGRQKVPLMREMLHSRWTKASWWLLNLGLPVAMLMLLLGLEWLLVIACAVLGVGLLLAAANIWACYTMHRVH
jgi:hypothetical protein